jgi:midasin (ATPase involved in ribosome maturation)
MAHKNPTAKIKDDQNYSFTLDNFYKMCLIVQRMRANIPIIIMGETGVGKTALIRYLVENVFTDKQMLFNIHAGTNEAKLIEFDKEVRKTCEEIKNNDQQSLSKKLWVFFDEFNTTEEMGYLSEIIM